MKTLRQHFEYLTELEIPDDEEDEIIDPVNKNVFDRLNKKADFDFRKGIVEPEPEEWEPDVRIGKPVEPYDREAEFLAAFNADKKLPQLEPGEFRTDDGRIFRFVTDPTAVPADAPAAAPAGWRYVEKGENPEKYGSAPADAPALDLSKDQPKYRLNGLTGQQELVPGEPKDTDTEVKQTTWRDIYRLNKKTIGLDPRLIKPGQLLKMPNGAPDYTVQKGDSLVKIASMGTAARPRFPHTPTPSPAAPTKTKTQAEPIKKTTSIPGNIQPRVTANTGLHFPPSHGFMLGKGEEIITPAILQAEKQAKADIAAYEKKQRDRELKQAAKRTMKESGPGLIKHLRDYIVEVETAPAFTPNQTMDPQQAAAANKAAQAFVAQLTDKVNTLAQTKADILKTVTNKPVSAPQPAPAPPAPLNEGLFDGIVSWVKDALAKNPLIDIALRLIPSPAQGILAAIDVIDAVKAGNLAQAAKVLANMIPGGEQVAQAIGVGQAAASGDATGVATGVASAALPKIGETTELDRILAIARYPR